MFAFSERTYKKIGSKNLMILGYFIITIATYGFGLLSEIENDTAFIVLAIVCRFMQGLAE
jgi:Na+/melibiose symporter-like transporter